MSASAVLAPPPAPRALRMRLRRGRRAHSTRTLGETLTDLYMVLLFLAIYGGAAVASLAHRVHGSGGEAHPVQARLWLLACLTLAGVGVAWSALRTVGPLLATPAGFAWCAGTPVDRRGWLLPRFAGLVAAAGVVGAVVGACAALVAAQPVAVPAGVPHGGTAGALGPAAAWAAAWGAALAATMAALAVSAQATAGRRRWPVTLGRVVTGAGVAGATAVVALDRLRFALPPATTGPGAVVTGLVVVTVAAAAVAAAAGTRRLRRLDRAALSAGAGLATAATTAVIWLDVSLLSSVLDNRRWRRIGRVHSRRLRPGGWAVGLLQAEIRRVARRPGALMAYAVLLLVPYGAELFSPAAAGIGRIIAAYLAAGRLASGLRTVNGSPALRRSLGGTDQALRRIHLLMPALGLTVWWLLALPAAPTGTGLVAVLIPVGVLAAVYRAATRPPLTYGGAMLDTPFGLLPVDLIRQLVRGPDILGALILVQLVLGR